MRELYGQKHIQPELRQRLHLRPEGGRPGAQAPGGDFRLRRAGGLRARRIRDFVQRHRRGPGGPRQPHHRHPVRRPVHRGGGLRPGLPGGLEREGAEVQLGAGVLRAVRRRQVQQQRRGQLRVLPGSQRPGLLRHPVRQRVLRRGNPPGRVRVHPPLREGRKRGGLEKGALVREKDRLQIPLEARPGGVHRHQHPGGLLPGHPQAAGGGERRGDLPLPGPGGGLL